MAQKGRLRVFILNRYFPPNRSVTGESAHELATFFEGQGDIDVFSISMEAQYVDSNSNYQRNSNNFYLKTHYHGGNKLIRFVSNFIEGYQLVQKAIKLEADVVITLTDPPLINFWAAKLLKKKSKIHWVNWTMDLYPNAFLSAGLVGSSNPFYRYLINTIKEKRPDLVIALGAQQKQFLEDNFYDKNTDFILLPCGIHSESKSKTEPEWHNREKIIFAYAGNLGEAHSYSFLINFIDAMDPEKHHLILSVYGSKAHFIEEKVKERSERITQVKSLSKGEFNYVDVHLVSLIPEWTNICVPSKAVSAVCAGSTILFFGDQNADTRKMLEEACFFVPFPKTAKEEFSLIQKQLSQMTLSLIHQKNKKAEELAIRLGKEKDLAFQSIYQTIKSWLSKESIQMTDLEPLLSIVIPYLEPNEALTEALVSIRNQTYKRVEVIILNAVPDKDFSMISQEFTSQVRVIDLNRYVEISDALNSGICEADGDYIMMLRPEFSYSHATAIENFVSKIHENGSDACFSNLELQKTNGQASTHVKFDGLQSENFSPNWLPVMSAFVFRKSCFDRYGNFNMGLKKASFYELLIRFVVKNKVEMCHLDQPNIKTSLKPRPSRVVYQLNKNGEFKLAWKVNNLNPQAIIFMQRLQRAI